MQPCTFCVQLRRVMALKSIEDICPFVEMQLHMQMYIHTHTRSNEVHPHISIITNNQCTSHWFNELIHESSHRDNKPRNSNPNRGSTEHSINFAWISVHTTAPSTFHANGRSIRLLFLGYSVPCERYDCDLETIVIKYMFMSSAIQPSHPPK